MACAGLTVTGVGFGADGRRLQATVRHFVTYTSREATENYRRFMALVDEYVDLMSERAAREIAKEAGDGRKTRK